MATGTFVLYFRVSTDRQCKSGLGLDAQRKSVSDHLNGGDWKVAAEFVEIESGKQNDRVELAKAVHACRVYGAKLLIAKLDRLSRDAHFLLGLEKAGVEFVAADNPTANRLTVGILAMVAEEEGRAISARTKAALQAAKARGQKLGGFRGVKIDDAARALSAASRQAKAKARASDLAPIVAEIPCRWRHVTPGHCGRPHESRHRNPARWRLVCEPGPRPSHPHRKCIVMKFDSA